MTVEYVVISLARGTGPDVSPHIAQGLDVLQVANEKLMVHSSTQLARLEKVHTVQVGDVHSSETTRDHI